MWDGNSEGSQLEVKGSQMGGECSQIDGEGELSTKGNKSRTLLNRRSLEVVLS